MTVKEVFTSQTCIPKSIVPKEGKLTNNPLHMNRENKNLKSRKKISRAEQRQDKQ